MSGETLIARLKTEGVDLAAAGGRLLLDAPEGVLTDELLAEIRSHKQEILAALQTQQSVATALPGGVTEARRSLLAADVVAMRLSEFARARLVVTVHSAVLNEVVVFASDNARVDPGEQRVVYRAAELRELLGLSAKDLRAVHRVKKTFRGTVLS